MAIRGAPAHKPTDKIRAEIIALRSYGIPVMEICKYVGITDKTMSKYYREEMDNSAMTANMKVGNFLFDAASGAAMQKGAAHADCLRAAMFWAKTRMGWREVSPPALETDDIHIVKIIRATRQDEPA